MSQTKLSKFDWFPSMLLKRNDELLFSELLVLANNIRSQTLPYPSLPLKVMFGDGHEIPPELGLALNAAINNILSISSCFKPASPFDPSWNYRIRRGLSEVLFACEEALEFSKSSIDNGRVILQSVYNCVKVPGTTYDALHNILSTP